MKELGTRLCETGGAARGVGGGSAGGARRDERQGLADEASSNAQGDERKGPHAKGGRPLLLEFRERGKGMSSCIVLSRCTKVENEMSSKCNLRVRFGNAENAEHENGG